MRIAYVCLDPGIPVFGTKGASVHIQEVIREFQRRGHDVRVYAIRRGDIVPHDLSDLHVQEFPIHAENTSKREEAQQQLSATIAAQIVADGADFIYERYSLFSTVLAVTSLPSVLEVNAPLIDEQRKHRELIDAAKAADALQLQVQSAQATICVSTPVHRWVAAHTVGGRVYTVANGVNTQRIHPSPEDTSAAPIVTFVGSLKPWHGVENLLHAAPLAQQDWRIRIIGGGPEQQALNKLAADLNLDIDFRGAVSPDSIPEHLAGTAIAVAPYPTTEETSEHYFSPLKIYEYMAAGLPIVASQVGQIPALLGAAGELVPPSNPQALASAIDWLVANPQRRAELGAKVRELAEKHHSWARIVDRILTITGVEEKYD